MSEVDQYLELGKKVHKTLDTPWVKNHTEKALNEYKSLDPPPAINALNGPGCPGFWDGLRHFVGDEHHYWLYDDWGKWLRQEAPRQIVDTKPASKLWTKLLGNQEDQYRMKIEGQEYLFDSGKFLYGPEIPEMGTSLNENRDALLSSCPESSRVYYSRRDQENIKERIESDQFVNDFIDKCCEAPEGSILWYRASP
ncbi:hypothetical protein [Natrinema limicola]|nr:hypothetical protein [Natrinema limicola]